MMIHAVTEETGIWMHTHGLRAHGLPELELRDAPTWLFRPGAELLNAIADYLLNSGKTVRPGEVIDVDGFGMVQVAEAVPREPIRDHYDHERWTLQNVRPELCPCSVCSPTGRRPGDPVN